MAELFNSHSLDRLFASTRLKRLLTDTPMFSKINCFCFAVLLTLIMASGCGQLPQAAISQAISATAVYESPPTRTVVKSDLAQNAILMTSVQSGDLKGVERALVNGADVNAENSANMTALMFATGDGNTRIVRILLGHGADVNRRSGEGETALMRAAFNGHAEVVKILLAEGAKINIQEARDRGMTALMGAAAGGHAEIVKLLIVNGADVKVKNLYRETALTLAQKHGHSQIVQMLRKAGG